MLVKQSRVPLVKMLTEGLLPSRLKVALYRARGATIGKKVRIGLGTVLVADALEIGDGTHIGFGTILRGREIKIRNYVKIGSMTFLDVEKIFIDEDAKINEQVFAGGPTLPDSYLHVGKRTIIMQYTFLNTTRPIIIKDGAGIGGKCTIFTHGSWQNILDGYPVKFAPVTIGENVWIPWEVFIMPGVSIGDGATIGAGSLVVKDIPAGALALGTPAKVLRTADEYPAALSNEMQRETLKDILDEYKNYLEYFDFEISETSENAGWQHWNLRGVKFSPERSWHLYINQSESLEVIPEAKRDHTVLSQARLRSEFREQLDLAGAAWLDLELKQRSEAGNDCMEELVAFIARYGIRCERVPAVNT